MKILFIAGWFLVASSFAMSSESSVVEQLAQFPDDPDPYSENASERYRDRMKELRGYAALPVDQKVIKLAWYLGIQDTIVSAEGAASFRYAQRQIIDVPNYAEIFHNYIEETIQLRSKGESTKGRVKDEIIVPAIGCLQTPQSVQLLGEYLSDTRDHKMMTGQELGGDYKPYEDRGRSDLAAQALSKMGIQNPPYKRLEFSPEARREEEDAWKFWYEQVKNGTRKFKFVGSDVEYSLKDRPAAPIREARDPRQKARSGSKELSSKKVDGFDDRAVRWPWIAALIAGLATGVYWLRRKKNNSIP